MVLTFFFFISYFGRWIGQKKEKPPSNFSHGLAPHVVTYKWHHRSVYLPLPLPSPSPLQKQEKSVTFPRPTQQKRLSLNPIQIPNPRILEKASEWKKSPYLNPPLRFSTTTTTSSHRARERVREAEREDFNEESSPRSLAEWFNILLFFSSLMNHGLGKSLSSQRM